MRARVEAPSQKTQPFSFYGFLCFFAKTAAKGLAFVSQTRYNISTSQIARRYLYHSYTILLYTTFLKKAREVGKKVRNFSYFSPHFYLFFVKNGLSPLSLRKGARETRQKEGIEKHIQGSFYGFLHFLERGGRRVYRHRQ